MQIERNTLSFQQQRFRQLQQQGIRLFSYAAVKINGSCTAQQLEAALETLLAGYNRMDTIPTLVTEQLPAGDTAGFINTVSTGAPGKVVLRTSRIDENTLLAGITFPAELADRSTLFNILQQLFDDCSGQQLAAAPMSYDQYISWQQQVMENADPAAAAFWNAPENKPRPELTVSLESDPVAVSGNYDTVSSGINAVLYNAVKEYAHRHKFQVQDVWFAAYTWLLSACSGADTITTGYIQQERAYEQLKAVNGPLAKVLPVGLAVLPGAGLAALSEAAGTAISNVIGWEDYYNASLSDTPLFPYAFEYVQEQSTVYRNARLQVSLLGLDAPADCHRLRLTVADGENAGRLLWHFDTACWNAANVSIFSDHLTALLKNILLHNNEAPLSPAGIPVTPPLTMPEVMPVKAASVVEMIAAQAALQPEHTAIVFNDIRLTYQELNRQADLLARKLQADYHIQKGDIVALLCAPSEKMVIAMLAIMKAGAAYLPIAPEFPAARIRHMLQEAAVPLLITESTWLFTVQEYYSGRLFALDIEMPVTDDAGSLPELVGGEADIAYVIYTSGSTGLPKGVMVKHSSLANYLQWLITAGSINANDSTLLAASAAFDLGYTSLWGALAAGAKLCIPGTTDIFDPAAVITQLQQEQVSFLKLTPTHFSMLMYDAAFLAGAARQLRLIILGGEAIRPAELQTFLQHYPEATIFNHYGPTETTIGTVFHRVTSANIRQFAARPVIGKGITNSRIYVLDEDGAPLPVGMAGELCIGGPGLAAGYLHQPELTTQKFMADPFTPGERLYRTGDLARRLPDGTFMFLGRKDQQLKIRGYRIEPGEIEAALMGYPGIKAAAVNGCRLQGGLTLAAYLVAEQPYDTAQLTAFLANHLPAWMIPAYFINLPALPRMANGKLDRQALPVPELYTRSAKVPYAAPRTETEKQLVKIWEEVLEREQVGINDNFFDLGGHSLKAVQVVSRVHHDMDVKMELRFIFDQPTIAAQAVFVDGAQKDEYSDIVPVAEAPYYAVSHAQQRLWMQDQVSKQQTAYNRLSAQVLDSGLQPAAFIKAFQALVARHEILRTTFLLAGGELYQQVHPVANMQDAFFEDLTATPLEDAAIRKITDQEAGYVFDMEKGPLLRMKLLRTVTGQYIFLLHIHHIISDGWTMEVLVNEVMELYDAFAASRPPVLAPLRIQYKDYAAWHNNQLTGARLERHRTFWHAQFADGIPVLELATDYPRPAIKTYNGANCGWFIDKATMAALQELNRRHGASLFMSLIAALNVLLYRYTGQDDIVIGTPVAGRDHKDLENQIGFYVNTLALRTRFNGSDNFQSLLEQVKQHVLDAYEHQIYPYDMLVDELVQERDRSRTPLFDVNLVLYNTREVVTGPKGMNTDLDNAVIGNYDTTANISRYDLLFHCAEMQEGLSINLEYNTDLFSAARMARMLQHFGALITAMAAMPQAPVSSLDYLSAAEKQWLLQDVNSTAAPSFTGHLLHELIAAQFEQNAALPAVTTDSEHYTYAALQEAAGKLAFFLHRQHEGRPFTAALLLDNSWHTIVAMLGILKAGGAFLPMDTSSPLSRLRYIITDSNAHTLITVKKYITAANKLQWSCPGLNSFICMDSSTVLEEKEALNELMKEELWDYVGAGATDDIEGGGWASSYTGEKLSRQEMDEYADNVLHKVSPLLNKTSRVLEIGCASGITMFRVAPLVAHYCGVDLSARILEHTRRTVAEKGFNNISLHHLAAHEITQVTEAPFDLVIINSVIQSFNGFNYLRDVLRKAITLLKPNGHIFIGDIQDEELRDALEESLQTFSRENAGKGYRTKTDWSNELFVPRAFWNNLPFELEAVTAVHCGRKKGTIENELLRFRYDALLTVDKTAAAAPAAGRRQKQQWGADALELLPVNDFRANITPQHPAYIIYTSGSTGNPKGVCIAHNSISNYVLWASRAYFSGNTGGNMALFTSTAFDLTLTSIFCPLYNGKQIYICRQPEVNDRLIAAMANLEIDTIKLTPTHISLLNLLPLDYTGIQQVIVGGEELKRSHISTLQSFNRDMRIYNEYGPTENTIGCTMAQVTNNYAGIGRPVANTRVYILDAQQQLLPQGCWGEICTAGDCLAIGYIGHAAGREQRFMTAPFDGVTCIYRTGDIGKYDEEGQLVLAGRTDDQVKIRGYRIELGEIAGALTAHPDVAEAAVLVKETDTEERSLAAFVVPRHPLNLKALREYLGSRLPAFMIPASFTELEALPLTAGGKIHKRKLLQLTGNVLESAAVKEMPRSDIEREMAMIWEEVLQKENIGIHDDFFELGGHSLKATQVVTRIYKQLHAVVGLATIFNMPTIAALAAHISECSVSGYEPVEPLPLQDHYAVSHAQQRLWIMDQLEDELIAYNTSGADMIRGTLDIPALEAALRQLLARHEILRTTFLVHNGEPRQQVHAPESFPLPLEVKDLRASANKELLVQEELDANTRLVFDLSAGPLLRIRVLQLDTSQFVMLFCMHHIISDGWSIDILMRELLAYYNAGVKGAVADLPPLRIQYKDYAAWQHKLLAKQGEENLQSFWKNLMKAPLPVLDLPLDFPRPAARTFNGDEYTVAMTPELRLLLQEKITASGATLFMTLLSGLCLLLHYETEQEDLVIGTPIAGRDHKDLEDQIGLYANTLPLRFRFDAMQPFDALLAAVKKVTIGAYAHAAYPFDRLLDDLEYKRDPSRSPLFDIMMVMQQVTPGTADTPGMDGIVATGMQTGTAASKFDLSFYFVETPDVITLKARYNTDLFKQERIAALCNNFISLLADALANSECSLTDLAARCEEASTDVIGTGLDFKLSF